MLRLLRASMQAADDTLGDCSAGRVESLAIGTEALVAMHATAAGKNTVRAAGGSRKTGLESRGAAIRDR